MAHSTIHFAHANGFPASTYSFLFELLEDKTIAKIECLGHGGFALNGNWHNLADEIIDSVERQADKPVIGLGHSLGGVVTLLAASKRPELFDKVVLLDPVLFSRRKRYAINLARALGFGQWIGPTRRTLVRKAQFESHQEAKQYFSTKTLFKNFHPRCMNDYVKHGLQPKQRGYELTFAPEIEAEVFQTLLTKIPKAVHQVKGVMIYGQHSKIVTQVDVRWWQRNFPHFSVVPFAGDHLFPLENPEGAAALLKQYLT